ncbi:hypothetical protein ACIOD2_19265 [Amycolatopsis sp. NPDC088138]|uniref:hypothetical protein n=1 Tax=Amycolatopsis sp. NPDC088138 TaxID=3363938 RepID=UPI0037F1518E
MALPTVPPQATSQVDPQLLPVLPRLPPPPGQLLPPVVARLPPPPVVQLVTSNRLSRETLPVAPWHLPLVTLPAVARQPLQDLPGQLPMVNRRGGLRRFRVPRGPADRLSTVDMFNTVHVTAAEPPRNPSPRICG